MSEQKTADDMIAARYRTRRVLFPLILAGIAFLSYFEFGLSRAVLVVLVCLFFAVVFRNNVLLLLFGGRRLDFNIDPFQRESSAGSSSEKKD